MYLTTFYYDRTAYPTRARPLPIHEAARDRLATSRYRRRTVNTHSLRPRCVHTAIFSNSVVSIARRALENRWVRARYKYRLSLAIGSSDLHPASKVRANNLVATVTCAHVSIQLSVSSITTVCQQHTLLSTSHPICPSQAPLLLPSPPTFMSGPSEETSSLEPGVDPSVSLHSWYYSCV